MGFYYFVVGNRQKRTLESKITSDKSAQALQRPPETAVICGALGLRLVPLHPLASGTRALRQ